MQTVDRKNCVRRLSFKDTAIHNHRSSRHWQEKKTMAWRVREHKHCKNWASFCLRFSLPPVFRWTPFCGHTKCLLFFSVRAQEKKQQKFGVSTKSHPTKNMRKEKNARRKSFFAMLEITMASSSGFLILCLCNSLLWLFFIKLFFC